MESTYSIDDEILESNITLDNAFHSLKSLKERANISFRGQHQLLARYIIKLFVQEWNRRKKDERKKGFYIYSNCTSLSKLCDCEPRTIHNQIKRLKEGGVILSTSRTGRGLKILINPEAVISFSVSDRKDFQGLVLEPSVKEKRTRDVDSLVTQRTDEKNTKEQHSTESKPKTSWFLMTGSVCCSVLANNFWEHAKKYIYENQNFSPDRDKAIVKLITNYYRSKSQKEQKEPIELHNEILLYLERARKWFKDRPEVKPPDPYHFFSHSIFGFRFWKLWDIDKDRQKKNLRERARWRIRRECLNLSLGQLKISKISLLRKHLNWIRRLGDKSLATWLITNSHKLYSI